MTGSYDDIIDLERPPLTLHAPMPRAQRAAQFAPFAALRGYDESIAESGREVDVREELSDEAMRTLESTLARLEEHIREKPVITVTYFVADAKKSGGRYLTETHTLKRIDLVERKLRCTGEVGIPLDDIRTLESDVLSDSEPES